MSETLQQLGLTKAEEKIYFTLLEHGAMLAGKVAQKAGIHRRNVYDALHRLIEKGLASYIVTNNRHYYQAEDPQRLLSMVKEREIGVKELLPQLELKFKMSHDKQETLFYKGKEGIKAIFEDQLREAKPIYIMGGSKNASNILQYYLPKYTKQRIQKKIPLNIIYAGKREKDKGTPLAKTRSLPEGYGGLAATNIYSDRVAIIIWSDEPLAILIKNKDIAESYMNYFKLLWGIAKDS
ncbi:MAG TPA: helix-turn-helix domain-containing protein [Candidatus Nanoarchaeia archaeon]|nr:helix-turn-helix domain-containing protein [Candidatus Nanoarchaeia archaeon]